MSEMTDDLLAIEMVFFPVLAFLTAFLVLAVRIRRTPGEILQLRLFQQHRELSTALIIGTFGVLSAFLHFVPYLLGLLPPIEWHLSVFLASTILLAVGVVWLSRIFLVPKSVPS